jgi:hypothetical protein
MSLKYCQGPVCHQYTTKDRLKGPQENKTYQTRRRSHMYYGKGNFCSMQCYNDWAEEFSDRAIDHFGRLTEPKHLTEDNAWTKRRNYNYDRDDSFYYFNTITEEQRPLTQEQFYDNSYSLNER